MDDFATHYSVRCEQARVLFDYAVEIPFEGTIVELGVCHGRTSAMLALVAMQGCARYYGVDFFGLAGTSASDVRRSFEEHELRGQIIEDRTQDVGREWSLPIDLLFVDAGHDEANVRPDCELWLPLVAPGGVAIFHDYDDPYDPASPHWAVRHYADLHTTGWERKISHGMLVARKPK